MTEPIVVTINAVEVDLALVDFDLSITHGRSDVTSPPTSSTCQLVIRGATGPAFDISDAVTITAHGVARFAGTISDLDVNFIGTNPPKAITTITGMGNLSALGLQEVGAAGWTEQTASQRVTGILTASGFSYLNGADTDITLKAVALEDATPTTALDALSSIASGTGATYFDDPNGRIVFESYGNRGLTTFAGVWATQTDTWTATSGTWGSFPVETTSTTMDTAGVMFAPQWAKNLEPLINDVTVTYGTDTSVNQSDAASIAAYGKREYRLDTQIKTVTDATTRAASIITAQANPLWNLGQISILVHELDATDITALMELVSGDLVIVDDLPAQGPYDVFEGIVEGWTDNYSQGNHTLTMSLSDPRFSYQILKWVDVLPELTWGEVDAAAQWFEIVSNNDLVGV